MIEINLLPEELRNRVVKPPKLEAARASGARPGLPQLILLIPLIFGVLLIAHILFAFSGVARSVRLNALKNKWEGLAAERKGLEDFNREYALFSGDVRETQRLMSGRVSWAEKLNKLSLSLPPGVWLENISVSGKDFQLHGKVVSLKKEEIALIRQFMDALKNDAGFFKDFNTLELSTVQKRLIGEYEVADFTLLGALKEK